MEVFIKVTNSLVMTRDKRLFIGVWMLFNVNNFCQFVNEDAKILTDGQGVSFTLMKRNCWLYTVFKCHNQAFVCHNSGSAFWQY